MLRSFSGMMLLVVSQLSFAADIQKDTLYPKVQFDTSMGKIVMELDRTRAPITVDNFLTYVVKGEYDNTVFHRIIPEFVVQGGGLDPDLNEKPEMKTIVNESGNGLSNTFGTIAMARESEPHTATRQFYFNVAENTRLDPSSRRWGYAVFGEVIEGEAVLQAMSVVPTEVNKKLGWPDVPVTTIILKQAKLLPRK
ncbi:peptidyl-prolyl cis-trans isomerase [Parashewanella spongiae]|uniref:Peptidyl-prolyl cis-trans isomerase n=1 Tax=Parashewanella spongiae TaxID=342950 RepID=A0A3A6U2V8_9GAMM|nr:peptidylprolyl isomerase [Parashewanella spongiae]MCL1077437.1 peptidyl-prolyl cis-trans isomerase [Parashewanella spongiae]RJY18373.1 peptidyl-prolyl cis-trans isomerase [Parashewanella spongiae]